MRRRPEHERAQGEGPRTVRQLRNAPVPGPARPLRSAARPWRRTAERKIMFPGSVDLLVVAAVRDVAVAVSDEHVGLQVRGVRDAARPADGLPATDGHRTEVAGVATVLVRRDDNRAHREVVLRGVIGADAYCDIRAMFYVTAPVEDPVDVREGKLMRARLRARRSRQRADGEHRRSGGNDKYSAQHLNPYTSVSSLRDSQK